MERNERLKMIAYHYGRIHQTKKAIEEMSELIKAFCKLEENPALDSRNEQYMNDAIEEIADVCVMMEQMKLFYNRNLIDEIIDKKIDRQIERICMGRD